MKRGPRLVGARQLAEKARARFVVRRRLLLDSYVGGTHAAPTVLVVLERTHEHMLRDYLRNRGATLDAWETYGPPSALRPAREALAAGKFDAFVERVRSGK